MRQFLIVSPRVFDALRDAQLLKLLEKEATYGKLCDDGFYIECELKDSREIEVHCE